MSGTIPYKTGLRRIPRLEQAMAWLVKMIHHSDEVSADGIRQIPKTGFR